MIKELCACSGQLLCGTVNIADTLQDLVLRHRSCVEAAKSHVVTAKDPMLLGELHCILQHLRKLYVCEDHGKPHLLADLADHFGIPRATRILQNVIAHLLQSRCGFEKILLCGDLLTQGVEIQAEFHTCHTFSPFSFSFSV